MLTLTLTNDEAIVLAEMLDRVTESEDWRGEHRGEEYALWMLSARFDRLLSHLFSPNYTTIVEQARERVRLSRSAPG